MEALVDRALRSALRCSEFEEEGDSGETGESSEDHITPSSRSEISEEQEQKVTDALVKDFRFEFACLLLSLSACCAGSCNLKGVYALFLQRPDTGSAVDLRNEAKVEVKVLTDTSSLTLLPLFDFIPRR